MVKALILAGDGINCESETAFALEQASAETRIYHINTLIESPNTLNDYQILALPGGFSFGDEVGSGKILALKLRHALGETVERFVKDQKLVIGICNGFQALVKLGLLPQSTMGQQQVTLTHNRQGRFINQWVSVQVPQNSLFFKGMESFMLPIRHGEGRLIPSKDAEQNIEKHIALQYVHDVNGSYAQTAGLINETGTVLGLMPHPEAFIRWSQHPAWTSLTEAEKATIPAGRQIFDNMIAALRN